MDEVAVLPQDAAPRDAPAGADGERRTAPVELLWDLVFVFAVTQVTALLSKDLSWAGFGRAMLALALIWWAWSAFVWAANAQETTSRALRLCLLVATVFIFVAGLAVPSAFAGEGILFATTYTCVRLLHLALYADASRKGSASWSAIAGFGVTVLIGMALLIAGSFLAGSARVALWALAAAIDYAGPAWLTRERMRGLQIVAVGHFVERYGLFVIICLGESIVAIGVGARGRALTVDLVAAAALGLMIAMALWWTYFDRFAATAEAQLRQHSDPVLAASDAYSYLHLVIIAGIIVFAVGAGTVVHRAGASMPAAQRLALCGGVAMYLIGHVAFRARLVREIGYEKLVVAVLVLALFGLGGGLPAWAVAGAVTALLTALCVAETAVTPIGARMPPW